MKCAVYFCKSFYTIIQFVTMKNIKFVILSLILIFSLKLSSADENGMMSTFADDSFPGWNGAMETIFIAEPVSGEFNGVRTEIEPQNKIFASGLNGIMDVLDPHTDSIIGHTVIVKKIDTPPVQMQLLYPVNGYLVDGYATTDLQNYLKAIQNDKVESIVITGYTDPTGPVNYNKMLSKKRADTAAKFLVDHGVASSKIKTVGAGIDSKQENFQQARRVEIVIYVK